MYQVELSEAALNDLQDFDLSETEAILSRLQVLEEQPMPGGVQSIPLSEAAGGVAYLDETVHYSIFYNIIKAERLVRVVAIFKKIHLN